MFVKTTAIKAGLTVEGSVRWMHNVMVTWRRGGAHVTPFRGLLHVNILHERRYLDGLCDGAHVLHLVGETVKVIESVHRVAGVGGGVGGRARGEDGRGEPGGVGG